MKIKKFIKENSMTLLLGFLIFSFVLTLAVSICIDTDFFWHIKAGEYMSKHGVLTKDVFSWYMYGKSWMSHEWLFEIIIYNLNKLLGNSFYFIFPFVCISILELIFFNYNKSKYLKNVPFTLVWIVFSLIFVFFIQIRPHLVSYIFLALTIWFLYDLYKNEEDKKIYFLPLISIIWANVHGGSSNLGYIFCFIFLITGLFSFNFSKIEAKRINKKQIVKYLVAMILSMGAVCINVHGFKMFLYPYQNMGDTLMLSNIMEWFPTVLSDASHYPYFILVVFILFVFIFSKRKIQFIDFVLFGISLFLGLKSIRFWPFTYIIMNFVVFDYVGKRKIDKNTGLGILLLACSLVLFCINNFPKLSLSTDLLDDKVITILKDVKPKRLYNMYDYGGILIYNDIKVFVDGRADLYSKYNYKDYLDMTALKGDYPKLIDKYDFDYLLVSNKQQINAYLKYSDKHELIYENKDKGFTLYRTIEK